MTGALDIQEHGKAKLLLLAGFLGSGKTTLLKRILSWETDLSGTVVLVNEFGRVGIDGAILRNAGSDVIELTSGCICCTIKSELARTLKDICDRFNPKRILLEATGVAEPEAVASVLEDEGLNQRIEIQKIVTVLDIKFWIAREIFGPFFMNQIEQADLILLNKVDLVDKNEVANCIREIHETIPQSKTVPTIYCEVDPEILWAEGYKRNGGLHAHIEKEDTYVAFDFSTGQPLNEACFNHFLEEVPWELFRIKGPVRFPDRTLLLNFVAGRSEWGTWDGDERTSLAFVGWRINGDKIIGQLKRCVLAE
ncbi:MAG: GTP-binding protein [Pseudomonadota bacterium]